MEVKSGSRRSRITRGTIFLDGAEFMNLSIYSHLTLNWTGKEPKDSFILLSSIVESQVCYVLISKGCHVILEL